MQSFSLKLDKRYKFLILSFFVTLYLYLFTTGYVKTDLVTTFFYGFVLVLLGTLVVHYPNIDAVNFLPSMVLPVSLLSGGLLSLHYFPNFGDIFKFGMILAFGVIYYLVSLMDNIFLVIHDREETIPLYRVALTWGQILEVIVAVPLFSSIFKVHVNGIIQSLVVALIAGIFGFYMIWNQRFDKDSKRVGVGESIYLIILCSFLVFIASASLIFIPTEAFLRALLVSSVLMFVLTYINSHLKNDISRAILVQNLFIIVIFLLLLVFFTP